MNPQTEAAQKNASNLFARLSLLGDDHTYTPASCAEFAHEIDEILALKKKRNAVILAHNYQRPEIFEVADFIGDSLELSRQATKVDADIIVFCGVHFMAETAKILNPAKTVLLPDLRAGCSLADSAGAEKLIERKAELRRVYPDLAVVSYVNTTAEVKAESDVCCTSANAVKIVNALPNQNILFLPDQNLARHVQENSQKNIIAWDGNCYVHHQIRPEQISEIRQALPHVKVLAHPECRQDVLALADAVLSTSGMVDYARKSDADEFLVVTECGLSDRLTMELPEKKFYRACKLCHFMKMITLTATLTALRETRHEIKLAESVRARAEKSLQRMLELS